MATGLEAGQTLRWERRVTEEDVVRFAFEVVNQKGELLLRGSSIGMILPP